MAEQHLAGGIANGGDVVRIGSGDAAIDLPDFVTQEFFAELRQRVLQRFDEMLEQELG